MENGAKIFLEALCGISVLFCLIYVVLIIRKRMTNNPMPFTSILIDKRGVEVLYDGNNMLMWLYFYTEGLVLEKEDGKRMCLPLKNIVSLKCAKEAEIFVYWLEFDPEVSEKDSLKISCVDDIGELFTKILPEEKLFRAE